MTGFQVDYSLESVEKVRSVAGEIIRVVVPFGPQLAVDATIVALISAAKAAGRSEEEILATIMMNWQGVHPVFEGDERELERKA